MKRTYTKVGKDYTEKEISKSISQIKWEVFRTENLPFCQGECLKVVIKECNIPISKINRMSLHGMIKNTRGFYALDVTYKNGRAFIYIVDNGCFAYVVCSDFMVNEKMPEYITCYKCGKKESTTKPHERSILFLHHSGEGRKPTCKDCSIILSKEGLIECINTPWHHLGTTCKICGLEG